jgi:RND family efflux transporter MFP subunit
MIPKPLSFTLVCLLVAALQGCGRGDEPPRREPVRPVRYVRVAPTPAAEVRTFAGISKAAREFSLSFRVGGTIAFIGVAVGDSLQPGQPIARLDPTDFQLNLRKAEAALASAEAETRNAAANFERMRALYENRNASRNDLDAARAAYESSQASVRALHQQAALARRQLDYTRLNAPGACAVAQVPVEVNENVDPGQAVAVISCGSHLEVKVAVAEGVIARIREQAQATATFDVIPAEAFAAVVTEVGVAAVGGDTTFPVTVRLETADSRIRPGMAAAVSFHLEGAAGAAGRIFLPPAAVGEDEKGRFVFTLERLAGGFGIAHRRSVEVGPIGAAGLEIVAGLSPDELVVTAGVSRIQEGLKVKLP